MFLLRGVNNIFKFRIIKSHSITVIVWSQAKYKWSIVGSQDDLIWFNMTLAITWWIIRCKISSYFILLRCYYCCHCHNYITLHNCHTICLSFLFISNLISEFLRSSCSSCSSCSCSSLSSSDRFYFIFIWNLFSTFNSKIGWKTQCKFWVLASI